MVNQNDFLGNMGEKDKKWKTNMEKVGKRVRYTTKKADKAIKKSLDKGKFSRQ